MATLQDARPSSVQGPVVRRRLRHVLNFGVHSLTATPHKDEVLQAAAAGSLGWQEHRSSRDDGAATASAGRPSGSEHARPSSRQRSLDDLDLVGKGRRRGTSAGSAKSLHIPPSSSPHTSPLLPSSSSFGALPSTSASVLAAPRRPSLSRARASSRLSWHGRPSPSGSPHAMPDELQATSPTLSPTVARFRSRSITRAPNPGGDLGGRGFVNDAEAIAEGHEEPASVLGPPPEPSQAAGGGYYSFEEERERALRDAGERLLESFITLKLSNVRASELLARQQAEAGSSGTLSVPNNAETGQGRSLEMKRKGKYREAFSPLPLQLGRQFDTASSVTSSDTVSSTSTSPTRATSQRTSISTHPSSPPTPRPKPDLLVTSPAPVRVEPLEPSASNPHATPFYISHPHRPATNPRFPELASDGSDFAPWARESGATREDTIGIELWVRKRGLAFAASPTEGWSRLKEWEVRFDDLQRWDGKAFLPPNTLTVRFLDEPAVFCVPSAAASTAGPHRLDRVASEPELHQTASRQPVVEWSGAEEAILRSLRETRMKAGVSIDDLQRLLRTQARLETARTSLRTFRGEVDALMCEFDETDLLRRQTHQVEAQTRAIITEQDAIKARAESTRAKIAKLQADVERRKQQLEIGSGILQDEQTRQRELEAVKQREEALRADVQAHLQAAQGVLARDLEFIFPIVPVANGRAQPIFTILSVALPLPSHPREPAPPLSLPSSQLPPGITVSEESVAAALGFVALLVDRLANYLGTKLPYPFTCAGSRSLVKDSISDITGPTRLFPLYSKGIERYRFEYAVFLLNKNIELLMVRRGLRIMDLRHTLPNLMNLLLTVSSARPLLTSSRDLLQRTSLHASNGRTTGDAGSTEMHSSSSISSADHYNLESESESEVAGEDDEGGSDAGDRTPRASEPSRGLFWGIGAGSGAKSTTPSEKTTKPHRSRRGTLIARAFVGQGNMSKEREQTEGGVQGPVATL